MSRPRVLLALSCLLLLLAPGCDAEAGAPAIVDVSSGAPVEVRDPTTESYAEGTEPPLEPPPLVEPGCARFDAAELGRLTPIGVPLALIQSDTTPTLLRCSFVGVAGDLDANVRIDVVPLDDRAEGYWTTAGQFESQIDIAGLPAVGLGRGALRTEVPGVGGLNLAVIMRRLSSDAPVVRDGDHLAIRDAVAAYVVERLSPETSGDR